MKGATTIQERLWELRKDKGLNLEELSQKTGISKSALASYESDDNKEINHGSLIALADFYEVSIDYLFCRTENREQINTPLSELHLTDEAVELLKSGRINNRLLCEIVTNDKFEQLMTDTEIYIDGHANIQKGFVKIARYQKQSGQLPTQEKMKTAVVRMDFPTTAVNLGDNIHFLFFCYWSCEVHPLRNASCNSILPRKNKVNY